jgi:hypothetical protein
LAETLLLQSAAILAMLTALGAVIDAFMLSPRRKLIYHKMENWWLYLIESQVPDIYKMIAINTLHFTKIISGTRARFITTLFALIPFSLYIVDVLVLLRICNRREGNFRSYAH